MGFLNRKRSLVAATPLLVAGLLLAGCDGDSVEATQTDYNEQTGAVCEKYQKVIEADQKKVQTLGSKIQEDPQPFIKVVKQFRGDWSEFVSKIKAIDPPPADRKQIDRFTAALTESEVQLDDLATIVDQLPGLLEDVKSLAQSPNTADAQALIKKANKVQTDIQKAESGFQNAANRANKVIDTYPGLANCR
ncbi:MAG: hypothetical protein ACO3CR_01565 [Solirubrobacterales bacterium]